MNETVKKKWVEALRSGKYKQGKEALNKNGKFCCLGVLCDLYQKDHTIENWKDPTPGNSLSLLGEYNFLPFIVMGWSGLNDDHGNRVSIHDSSVLLTRHNDRGRTFEEIAQAIEEQL